MRKSLFISFLLILAIPAFADELQVDKEKQNLAKVIVKAPSFISLAPVVGDFEGKTERIDGYVFWTGDDMSKDSELYFEVDLNALDTGIGLRNRHMRENYLETAKYPFAQFTAKVDQIEKGDENRLLVTASGKMKIHGVEQPLTIEATVTTGEDGYHVQTEFMLKLSDFKIDRGAVFKIGDDITVVLDYYLKKAA